jgi:nucleoside-triphosphatase THEP1
MKILVTAPPRTGKSTLIRNVVELLNGTGVKICHGVLSTEKLDPTGSTRIGFTALLSDGRAEEFMIKTEGNRSSNLNKEVDSGADVSTEMRTYSRAVMVGPYQVLVNVIDEFVVPKLKHARDEGKKEESLIYIDEIGRAQALSPIFLATVGDIISSCAQCVLASIVHEDEDWSLPFKEDGCVWLIEVTVANRSYLPRILEAMIGNAHLYNTLPACGQQFLKDIFFELLRLEMFHAAKKLFSNTIRYIIEGRITSIDQRSDIASASEDCVFKVLGDTSQHEVRAARSRCPEADSDVLMGWWLPARRPQAATVGAVSAASEQVPNVQQHSLGQQALSLSLLSSLRCDCPLSRGTTPFEGQPQICSHVLAALIWSRMMYVAREEHIIAS